MKFFLALVVWFAILFVLAAGIVLTVNGKGLLFTGDLLIAGILGYLAAFTKYGCFAH